tara:strand:+ start:304 stop:498 length:195 start_codon:yes stop_codon:yes gene_type:complete
MKEVAELLERSTKRAKDIERDTEKIQRSFKLMETRFENQEYEQQKITQKVQGQDELFAKVHQLE